MDEHYDIIVPIIAGLWLVLVSIMGWFFKKLLAIQDDIQSRRGVVNTAVAVLQSSQEDLRKEFDKDAKRNSIDHQRILDRIDMNHERMMGRMDSLVKVVKNGH